jgi:hypothetical protein
MKTKNLNSMGAIHPILFLAAMYVVTLVVSIFICSSLFYSCNAHSSSPEANEKPVPQQQSPVGKDAISLR